METAQSDKDQIPDPIAAQATAIEVRKVLLDSKGLKNFIIGLVGTALAIGFFFTHDDSNGMGLLLFCSLLMLPFYSIIIHKFRRRSGVSGAMVGEVVEIEKMKENYTEKKISSLSATIAITIVIIFFGWTYIDMAYKPQFNFTWEVMSIIYFLGCLYFSYFYLQLVRFYRLIGPRSQMLYQLIHAVTFASFAVLFLIFHAAVLNFLFLYLGLDLLLSGLASHIRWRRWIHSLPRNGDDHPEAQI